MIEKRIDMIINRAMIKIIVSYLCCTSIALVSIYFISDNYICSEAEKKIESLLLSHKGIHHYVQKTMLPALYEYKKNGDIPDSFYAPELFSSSFIVRNQHDFYNKELIEANYPELYYKLAANNPRNPVNKSDNLERELINIFNTDKSVKKYRKIVNINGREFLYVAIPFLENEERCMVCHGKRKDAPAKLQYIYPGEGGFNEKVGEIRAITSIRAPLDLEHRQLLVIVSSLALGTLAFAFLAYFNSLLRRRVKQRTESLEETIKSKEKIASQLVENEMYLKTMQDSMQVGLILIDPLSYEIADINNFGLELVGTCRDNVVGKKCFSFICPSQHGACPINDLHQTLDKSERKLITYDSNEKIVLKNATKVKISEKEYILESFIDISEIKNMEAIKSQLEVRLQQAQKMESLGTLAGGIAHDFNNILGAIIGYAEMAQDGTPLGSSASNNLSKVLEASHRASGLVKQILAFSRQADSELISLQPAHVINEAIELLRPTLPSTIVIKRKINTTKFIIADPSQMHQILMNLCINAFHAMEQTGGIIDITLVDCVRSEEDLLDIPEIKPGKFVMLSVGDSGQGIAPEVTAKIFDPYFTTKEIGKGTGMGLAIIHGIVTKYNGYITCDSELGKGSVFSIFFPAIEQEAGAVQEKVMTGDLPTGIERILFIDDEEMLVDIGKETLTRLGYEVTVRTSSLEALDIFQDQPDQFDLIITDQTMPGITGLELARRIRLIRPDIPIILCTGYSTVIDKDLARTCGITRFAMKPLAKKDIAVLVRKVLDESRSLGLKP